MWRRNPGGRSQRSKLGPIVLKGAQLLQLVVKTVNGN
jgi:hypothetical protein